MTYRLLNSIVVLTVIASPLTAQTLEERLLVNHQQNWRLLPGRTVIRDVEPSFSINRICPDAPTTTATIRTSNSDPT